MKAIRSVDFQIRNQLPASLKLANETPCFQKVLNSSQPLYVVVGEPQSYHPPPSPVTPAPAAPPSGSSLSITQLSFPLNHHNPGEHHQQTYISSSAPAASRSRRITVDSMARLLKRREGKGSPKSPTNPTLSASADGTPDLLSSESQPDDSRSNQQGNRSELPWFIRPRYDEKTLIQHPKTGLVTAGTNLALFERLIEFPNALESPGSDSLKKDGTDAMSRKLYRDAFLMTFRTFLSAEVFFDFLTARYEEDPSNDLSEEDFELWRDLYMIPQQRQILDIFRRWSTCCDMLSEEPYIVPKLVNFLGLIPTDGPLASIANQLLQSLRVLVRLEVLCPN